MKLWAGEDVCWSRATFSLMLAELTEACLLTLEPTYYLPYL